MRNNTTSLRTLTTALSVCAGDVIIIHPSERTLSVAAGESILLKCQAVDGARITWYHQSTEIAPHGTARRRVEEVCATSSVYVDCP